MMSSKAASILDESGDNSGLVGTNESTIKLESSSSVSGAAAIAAYYCNSYPLATSSPGLVTAVSTADRNSSMLVSGTYSNLYPLFFSNRLINFINSDSFYLLPLLVDPRTMHLSTGLYFLIMLKTIFQFFPFFCILHLIA